MGDYGVKLSGDEKGHHVWKTGKKVVSSRNGLTVPEPVWVLISLAAGWGEQWWCPAGRSHSLQSIGGVWGSPGKDSGAGP